MVSAIDPAVAWLLDEGDPAVRALVSRELVAGATRADVAKASPIVRALLTDPARTHPYAKWSGAHWRLVSLAELATGSSGHVVGRTADGEPRVPGGVHPEQPVVGSRPLTGQASLTGWRRSTRCASAPAIQLMDVRPRDGRGLAAAPCERSIVERLLTPVAGAQPDLSEAAATTSNRSCVVVLLAASLTAQEGA